MIKSSLIAGALLTTTMLSSGPLHAAVPADGDTGAKLKAGLQLAQGGGSGGGGSGGGAGSGSAGGGGDSAGRGFDTSKGAVGTDTRQQYPTGIGSPGTAPVPPSPGGTGTGTTGTGTTGTTGGGTAPSR